MMMTTVRRTRRMVRAALVVVLLLTVGIPLLALAQVPREARQYRHDLVRQARLVWGLNAPVSTFGAQIHQESAWRPDARSPYAAGLAQFTPATADWIGGVYTDLAERQPYNPAWALRALVRYDLYLWQRMPMTAPPCDRMAFALAAYNGGAGWIARDRRAAAAAGVADDRWWDAVARYNAGRAPAMFAENRGYPQRILRRLEPIYIQAGWGIGSCA